VIKRTIKKYGNTFAIKLEPKDLEDFGWELGEAVDVSKVKKIKKKNEN
jgi:hypothetical protein